MDFIDKHTDWSKQRLTSTRMERVSGFKVKDELGKETEQGYLSAITGITLKNDPERLRGTRGKLVLFEEGGKFPNLETAWRVEQPAVETDDGKAFGLLIAYGTGGTEGCLTSGNKVYTADGRRINISVLFSNYIYAILFYGIVYVRYSISCNILRIYIISKNTVG